MLAGLTRPDLVYRVEVFLPDATLYRPFAADSGTDALAAAIAAFPDALGMAITAVIDRS
ncbi:MAG TPA: hypothetical protein VNT52_10985 [Acidimicrobiales bacterium]|nr:hypothetical protein [Acidimicrobiales bacterium]